MDLQQGMLNNLTWPVWEDYQIKESNKIYWVVPNGKKIKDYNAGGFDNLPTEFARISHISNKEDKKFLNQKRNKNTFNFDNSFENRQKLLLAFMKKFGGLGQTRELGSATKIDEMLYEGDQLIWALDHADQVDLCLKLAWHHKKVNEDKLYQILKNIKERQENVGSSRISTLISQVQITFNLADIEKKPMLAAQEIFDCIMSLNMAFPKRVIKNFSSTFEFCSLIQLIYWLIADKSLSERLRQCKECGTVFFAKDDRQEFCPPVNARESQCRKRFQIREYRKHKREVDQNGRKS